MSDQCHYCNLADALHGQNACQQCEGEYRCEPGDHTYDVAEDMLLPCVVCGHVADPETAAAILADPSQVGD